MIKKCIGCGIPLQSSSEKEEGYVSTLDKNVCERCFRLKNYGEYREVTLNNTDYQKIIDNIPKESLVIYLTSVLNVNLEYIDKLNNVLIVLTKKDLLPKSVKDYKLINYVRSVTTNYLDIEIISSLKNYNLDNLIAKIKKYSRGKDVYIVGMTGSGKSTLINKLIKNYSNQNIEVTTSIYPSTTLGTIKILIDDLSIIDTPGLISKGSILSCLKLSDIKKITPKKEIKPRSYQLKGKGSLLIEDFLRIDYYEDNNITIYLANNLKITKMKQSNPKLKYNKNYSLTLHQNEDVVIEDLCFIKFTNRCHIDLYLPYQLDIVTRKNLI